MSDFPIHQHAPDPSDDRLRRLGTVLAELGWDAALQQLADDLPDARERLAYVGRMTEAAATTVLDLVDAARPACAAAAAQAEAQALRLAALAGDPALDLAAARAALADAGALLQRQALLHRTQAAALGDIMMAQDFQDLSGQVIAKVVRLIGDAEQQLGPLLAQGEGRAGAAGAAPALDGPQLPTKAVGQDEVDELMASLGF